MSGGAAISGYQPRPVRAVGILEVAGLRLKQYVMTVTPEHVPDPRLLSAAAAVAAGALPAATATHGVGFLLAHHARPACFVLLDWGLFSKVKRLWAIYLLTIPFVLTLNAMRIAALFLYAEWNVWRYNRNTATWATIEAFHSNIGWVMYSVAFAVFLPLVYRWARRAKKVK